MKLAGNKGIRCYIRDGPTFGGKIGSGKALISNNSNLDETSWSNLCHSNFHPDNAKESNEGKSFLTSSKKFKVLDIEVYLKKL
jgi:hypothetical protein